MNTSPAFFTQSVKQSDPELAAILQSELTRQKEGLELIASENYVSAAVMEVQGSVLTNKYSEGYPHKRYYGGNEFIDQAEDLAIARVTKLFGCSHANVQPHAGAPANLAAFMAYLNPGDTYMGMRLDQGGHLTHGSPVNFSGKWFNVSAYGVGEDEYIDYDALEEQAHRVKPKMIVSGATVYPREFNFKRMGEIARSVGAILMADIAHIAGLVATGEHQSPFPHAQVVTSTTHKTLRGPRGGLILTNDEENAKLIDKAVFPGLQGGPLDHVIAAKAVAFGEALKPEFKTYCRQIKLNAKAMAEQLAEEGLRLVSGGTDNHLCLVDLRPFGITGKVAQIALDGAALTTNKNTIPNDPEKPFVTSGLRLGSPAGTTRGLKETDFRQISSWIAEVLRAAKQGESNLESVQKKVKAEVLELCQKHPIYTNASYSNHQAAA